MFRSSPKLSRPVSIQYAPDSSLYKLITVIGKGHSNTSTIFLAKHIPSGTLVAVKRINLEVCDGELSYFQNEIMLSQQLSHPYLLPFHCSFISGQELWVVMPLSAYGSCKGLINAYFTSGMPEQAILFILRDVLIGLDYIHHRGVIHRGVKASHVMIAKNGQVCLSGLHNSLSTIQNGKQLRKVHDFPLHTIDCLYCYSPELLEQNMAGYGPKSDIYSVGVLACELANGQSPFTGMPVTQMLLEKLSGAKARLADSTTVGEFLSDVDMENHTTTSSQKRANAIFFTRTFSSHLHDFVSLCLERDPFYRPSASQLLTHPVFKSIKSKPSSILPSLLHPVIPLTDITNSSKELPAVDEEFMRKLSEVSMQEDWTF